MRAKVSFGTAGETILQHGFEQKIAEPRHAGPTIYVSLTMRSEIEAISPLVDQLRPLVRAGHCVSGDDSDVEVALREALANAVLHGNKQDIHKKVHVSCRIRPGKELSLVVRDEGNGFDPAKIPDPPSVDNANSENGRGICLMKLFMDAVSFEQGGCEVRLQKGLNWTPGSSCSNEPPRYGKPLFSAAEIRRIK
jgi:serine/threonine-protein kinase RsbW